MYGYPNSRDEALTLQTSGAFLAVRSAITSTLSQLSLVSISGVLPSKVILLHAPDAVLVERFIGRRIDPQTNRMCINL